MNKSFSNLEFGSFLFTLSLGHTVVQGLSPDKWRERGLDGTRASGEEGVYEPEACLEHYQTNITDVLTTTMSMEFSF